MSLPEQVSQPSLPEVHRSVAVPHDKGFWRKLLAYSGPGYLVSIGYMDPGNWATDLAWSIAMVIIALNSWLLLRIFLG